MSESDCSNVCTEVSIAISACHAFGACLMSCESFSDVLCSPLHPKGHVQRHADVVPDIYYDEDVLEFFPLSVQACRIIRFSLGC